MRRLQFVAGGSAKFWQVSVRGKTVETRWGRIGSEGQRKTESFDSSALASAAAAKQVREKLAKGYADPSRGAPVGAPTQATKARAPATKTKAAKPAAPAPRPKAATAAGKFAFTAEQDALFARGWPHLCQLVDGPAPRGGVARAVRKELDAIDPEFPIAVQRDVAASFLRAMMVDRRDEAARARALASTAPIDDQVLTAILERLCPALVTETYQFRIQDAVFLLEAFLGTEHVAEALVERFVLVAGKPRLWDQLDNAHDHAYHMAHALGFMRLRMAPARWKKLIAPLAKVKPSKLLFTERLALLADPRRAVPQAKEAMRMITLQVLLERDAAAPLRACFDKVHHWHTPRFYYVAGADLLDRANLAGLPRLPAWQQQRVAGEFGTIRHRATVRVMMWLLSARSARKDAADWLAEHAAFARPILEAVQGGADAREAALATAALAVLGGAQPVIANKQLTGAQVNKEVSAVMAAIERQLIAAKGDADAEVAALKAAFTRYCEARAAGGDCTPEAYFTHYLGDLKWKSDRDAVTRWLDQAVEVMSSGA